MVPPLQPRRHLTLLRDYELRYQTRARSQVGDCPTLGSAAPKGEWSGGSCPKTIAEHSMAAGVLRSDRNYQSGRRGGRLFMVCFFGPKWLRP